MARGTHHGGSSHRGSYHSSSHSSSSRSYSRSSSRSSSYHSSSSRSSSYHSSSHSGGYSGGSVPVYDDVAELKIVRNIMDAGLIIITFFVTAFQMLAGAPLLFLVAAALDLVAIIIIANEMLFPISDNKSKSWFHNRIPDGAPAWYYNKDNKEVNDTSAGYTSDYNSWYSNHYYFLELSAFYRREENLKKTSDFLKKQPWILKAPRLAWAIATLVSIFVGFFFYELIIPIFENMIMSDAAFAFVDVLVYLFPCILAFVFALICLITDRIFHARARLLCKAIVDENNAQMEIETQIDIINIRQKQKWYYNVCPACGFGNGNKDTECQHCGISLRIQGGDFDVTKAHQVKDIQTVDEAKDIKD